MTDIEKALAYLRKEIVFYRIMGDEDAPNVEHLRRCEVLLMKLQRLEQEEPKP